MRDLPLPPAAHSSEGHGRFASEVAEILADEVRRLDTAGFTFSIMWNLRVGNLDYVRLSVGYCDHCTKLHHTLDVWALDSEDGPIATFDVSDIAEADRVFRGLG